MNTKPVGTDAEGKLSEEGDAADKVSGIKPLYIIASNKINKPINLSIQCGSDTGRARCAAIEDA